MKAPLENLNFLARLQREIVSCQFCLKLDWSSLNNSNFLFYLSAAILIQNGARMLGDNGISHLPHNYGGDVWRLVEFANLNF